MNCKVDGCGDRIYAKKFSLCFKHYRLLRDDVSRPVRACAICGNDFSPYSSNRALVYCSKPCRSKAHAKREREREGSAAYHKRYKWAWKLRKQYGITVEDYEAMRAKQEGRCAICKRHEMDIGEILSVDHCHATGKCRGLLCRQCNAALGAFDDDPNRLIEAAAYLATFSAGEILCN